MARMKVEFDGFDQVMNRLKKLEGDVKGTTEKALKETHKIVTTKAEQEIRRHKRSGRTEESLQRQANVEWNGSVAQVHVGFDIKHGGLASIFLMYGTPKIPKDQKLYNAFFGRGTIQEIRNAQQDIFYDEIRRLGG